MSAGAANGTILMSDQLCTSLKKFNIRPVITIFLSLVLLQQFYLCTLLETARATNFSWTGHKLRTSVFFQSSEFLNIFSYWFPHPGIFTFRLVLL